jgi:hypothetical protein
MLDQMPGSYPRQTLQKLMGHYQQHDSSFRLVLPPGDYSSAQACAITVTGCHCLLLSIDGDTKLFVMKSLKLHSESKRSKVLLLHLTVERIQKGHTP